MTYLIAIFTNAIMIRSFLPDKSHFPSQGFLSGSENLVFGRWIYLVLFLLKALLYNFALFVSLYLYILSYSHTKFVLTSTFKSIFNVNIIYCYISPISPVSLPENCLQIFGMVSFTFSYIFHI